MCQSVFQIPTRPGTSRGFDFLTLHNYRHEGNFVFVGINIIFLSRLSKGPFLPYSFYKEGCPWVPRTSGSTRRRAECSGWSVRTPRAPWEPADQDLLGQQTADTVATQLGPAFSSAPCPILFAASLYKTFRRCHSSILILSRFYTRCHQTVRDSWKGNPLRLSVLRGQFVGYRPRGNPGQTAQASVRRRGPGTWDPALPFLSFLLTPRRSLLVLFCCFLST